MESLKELDKKSYAYYKLHYCNGGSSEFDMSINDINREKIEAMKIENGKCYLAKFNVYNEDKNKPHIVEYKGQMVYNFEYDIIIPEYDQDFETMLIDYHNDSGFKSGDIMKKITALTLKIEKLGGRQLTWV